MMQLSTRWAFLFRLSLFSWQWSGQAMWSSQHVSQRKNLWGKKKKKKKEWRNSNCSKCCSLTFKSYCFQTANQLGQETKCKEQQTTQIISAVGELLTILTEKLAESRIVLDESAEDRMSLIWPWERRPAKRNKNSEGCIGLPQDTGLRRNHVEKLASISHKPLQPSSCWQITLLEISLPPCSLRSLPPCSLRWPSTIMEIVSLNHHSHMSHQTFSLIGFSKTWYTHLDERKQGSNGLKNKNRAGWRTRRRRATVIMQITTRLVIQHRWGQRTPRSWLGGWCWGQLCRSDRWVRA